MDNPTIDRAVQICEAAIQSGEVEKKVDLIERQLGGRSEDRHEDKLPDG